MYMNRPFKNVFMKIHLISVKYQSAVGFIFRVQLIQKFKKEKKKTIQTVLRVPLDLTHCKLAIHLIYSPPKNVRYLNKQANECKHDITKVYNLQI